MPRYFFDIDDGARTIRDQVGTDCADDKAAYDAAIGVLPNIARDILPDGQRRDFIATVKDQSGEAVFRATLSLRTERLRSA